MDSGVDTHTRWQLVANDSTGAPTLTDMGASFAIATGGVLTLFIAAPPNGSSVWARVVDEVSGAVFGSCREGGGNSNVT